MDCNSPYEKSVTTYRKTQLRSFKELKIFTKNHAILRLLQGILIDFIVDIFKPCTPH